MSNATENLTEIGVVFEAVNASAVIDLMAQVKDAAVRIVEADDKRLEASAKVSRAQATLSAQIDRSILSYAGSKAAVLEYSAAQIGQTAALADQLAMLRELEQHDRLATEAFAARKKENKDAAQIEAQRVRDEKAAAVARAKALDEENKLYDKAMKEQSASRKKLNEEYAAMEKQLIEIKRQGLLEEANIRHKAILTTQDAAKDFTAINNKQADDAARAAERQALEEIKWANTSVKERIRVLKELQQYQASTAISPATVSAKFGSAAVGDASHLAKYEAEHAAAILATSAAHVHASKSAKTFSEIMGEVNFNTSLARSEMIVIAHEAVQGRFSRIPASMMVFAEYTNLGALAMTGIGLATMATVAALVVLAIATANGALEFEKINAALTQTGSYSGITTANFYEMASALVVVHGSIGEAKEALQLLAGSGRFTKEQIETIAPAITEMAHSGGVAVDTLVKQFEKLAKDPVAASKELNEQYHYLTASIYEQIRALVEQGDKQGAATLAEEAYATATKARGDELTQSLGYLSRGWHSVADGASRAWNAMMGLGRPEQITDKIANIGKDIENARERIANPQAYVGAMGGNGFSLSKEKENLQALIEQQASYFKQKDRGELNAKEKADRASLEQTAINAQDIRKINEKKDYTQLQKRQDASAKVYSGDTDEIANALAQNGVSMASIEEARKRINLGVHATTGDVLKASKDRYDAMLKLAKDSGNALLISEESTQQRIRNIEIKKHDRAAKKATPDHPNVELTEYVRGQQEQQKIVEETADRAVRVREKQFASERKVEDERFAELKARASGENASGLLTLQQYSDHVAAMKALDDKRAADVRKIRDDENAAGELEMQRVIARASVKEKLTKDEATRREGVIRKAQADQKALVSKNEGKGRESDESSDNREEEVKAEALRQGTVEVYKRVVAVNKEIATEQEKLEKMGISKKAANELAKSREFAEAATLSNMVTEMEAALTNKSLTESEVEMYNKRMASLRALIAAREKLANVKGEQAAQQQVADTYKETEKVFKKAMGSMEDAIVDFAMTGKLSFSTMANSIIADLIRIQVQQQAMPWLNGLLKTGVNMLFGGADVGFGSNANGFQGTMNNPSAYVANADGNVFNSASLSSYSGGVYNSPQTFAFAKGAGVFAEAGPEAIMPLSRGSDGKLGVRNNAIASGGGDTTINITVDATGSKIEGDASKSRQLGATIANAVRAVITQEKMPGGMLA